MPINHLVIPVRQRSKIRWYIISLLLMMGVGGVLYDLYRPVRSSLREFDTKEVARLETAMWRSYYDKERLILFGQLSEHRQVDGLLPSGEIIASRRDALAGHQRPAYLQATRRVEIRPMTAFILQRRYSRSTFLPYI